MNTNHLVSLLVEYRETCNDEQREHVGQMITLIEEKPNTYFNRKECNPGHICASAWVINAVKTHALLAHHKTLNRLIQFGGHINAEDVDIHAAIIREVEEETGLKPRLVSSKIYDVDIHSFPSRPEKNEPAHKHFDVRFLIEVPFVKPQPPKGESQEINWYELDALTKHVVEKSVLRMSQKTLSFIN